MSTSIFLDGSPAYLYREWRMAGKNEQGVAIGPCEGLVKASPMSFARFSTDDRQGGVRGYVGEGRFTDDPLTTFGGAGVVEIPNLQRLLRGILAGECINTISLAGFVKMLADPLLWSR
jgi:hypothetical protein